jgi:hypothetical protein
MCYFITLVYSNIDSNYLLLIILIILISIISIIITKLLKFLI